MMARQTCIFCDNQLNRSNEHIIPASLNGKLTSRGIICSNRNARFGKLIDSELKEQLNPLLLIMGFKNAQQFHVEAADNKTYLMTRNLKLEPIKPELYLKQQKNKKELSIIGRSRDIKGVLQKMNELLSQQLPGGKFVIANETSDFQFLPAVKAPLELNISEKVILLFNKIALEFFALHHVDLRYVQPLLKSVHMLEEGLNNVVFCNAENEVWAFSPTEISHLIILRGNSRDRKLRAYIELFNLYCGVVVLSDAYTGDDIDVVYYQDAITGNKIPQKPTLKQDITGSLSSNLDSGGLEKLLCLLSERHRERSLAETLDENLGQILSDLKKLVKAGTIKEKDVSELYFRQAAGLVAQLAFSFPYSIEVEEGKKPYEDDNYNFYHSNFRKELVDPFIEKHKNILTVKIFIDDELFRFVSFYKEDVRINPEAHLVRVYVVLEAIVGGRKVYLPVRKALKVLHSATPLKSEELETLKKQHPELFV